MAVGLCHSDKKAVCRNLQYSENVNMPDSPGWKWVQTVQTETADRYLIRLKSREEGRARKTYRVEVKEDTVDAKSAPNVTQIVLLLLLLPLLGIIFAGLRYSLTSLNPQDDLQLVLILTVIAAILGLRIWPVRWRWKNRKSGSGWRSGTCRRRTGVTAACRQSHLRHLHWGESYFCTRLRTGLTRPMTLHARCF